MGTTQTRADEAARNDAFLRNSAEPVRAHLSTSVELAEFLRDAGSLTLAERRLLVEQALVLLEQNYVHLPLKIAMHGINPLQRLRLLGAQLEGQSASMMDPEWTFHAELSAIFHSLHDLHTNYILPEPFAGKIAYLPFQVEEFFADGASHFVIARLAEGYSAPGLEPGAEVTSWNGIPVARAVDLNAARFAGSNAAARHARGLQSLTIRSLHVDLPPDEHWVTMGFAANDGSDRELRQAWLVVDNLPAFGPDPDQEGDDASLGLDFGGDATARATKLLFAPGVVAREDAERQGRAQPRLQAPDTVVDTPMPGLFRASAVTTASGTYGHLRIFTFRVPSPRAFVDEFVRLLAELPQDGLILDIRGNPGGTIQAGELALQTLTPSRIVPEPVQFINTPLNLVICRRHRTNATGAMDLGPWFPSIEQSLTTGATFSQAFPMTPEDEANALGQAYHGPVVLITDARCYSAGDIFAAGFQDHAIGPVLGVDDNTGAGGANVWTHGRLMSLLEEPKPDADSPYRALPKGASMSVAMRRSLRVGPAAGNPLEDLGVVPDVPYRMTRADVLEGNVDLLARAGELLAKMPVYKLVVTTTHPAKETLEVALQVANVDRVDIFVDARPRASVDVRDANASVTVTGVGKPKHLRVDGFNAGKLVATRLVVL